MERKIIISRILAVAVFFMGVTIGVAQEKSAANGNAEVLESVEVEGAEAVSTVVPISYRPGIFNWIVKSFAVPSFQEPDTYFLFIGDPGEESDPTKWIETTGPGDCETGNEACVVLVRGAFVNHVASPKVIIPATLPGGQMPVIPTTGLNQVPDPSAAGTGSSQPYADANQIYNKN